MPRPLSKTLALVKAILLPPLVALGSAAVPAHVNERGMDYTPYKDHRGVSCCSDVHCRPATAFVDTTESGRGVVRLLIDGEWFSVSRYFVVAEDATDGRAHWCGRTVIAAGSAKPVPVPFCIILPPRTI